MNIYKIKVEIEPTNYYNINDSISHFARIDVELWGGKRIGYNEIIPHHDFATRFQWMMERATKEIAAQIAPPGFVVE